MIIFCIKFCDVHITQNLGALKGMVLEGLPLFKETFDYHILTNNLWEELI